jgi:hypothetical protein
MSSPGRQFAGVVTLCFDEIRCASPEHLQQLVQMGVADGTSGTLNNLVSYVGGDR